MVVAKSQMMYIQTAQCYNIQVGEMELEDSKEILQLISEGKTYKEAADELHLSKRTIDYRINIVSQVLGDNNGGRNQLAVIIRNAILKGVIDGPSVPTKIPTFIPLESRALELLKRGCTTKQIKEVTGSKIGTIDAAIERACYKCGATTRTHLVAIMTVLELHETT